MFAIGTTQKMFKELNVKMQDIEMVSAEHNVNWHMNLFKIGRYKCIALINDLTLYSLVIPRVKKADLMDIENTIRENLKVNMLAQDFDEILVEKLLNKGQEMVFTKTHSRNTVGCLIEMIKAVEHFYPTEKDILSADPLEINRFNSRMIFLKHKGYPIDRLKEYLNTL